MGMQPDRIGRFFHDHAADIPVFDDPAFVELTEIGIFSRYPRRGSAGLRVCQIREACNAEFRKLRAKGFLLCIGRQLFRCGAQNRAHILFPVICYPP